MPTNLYGPNDNYHPTHSHVLPALIRRFHEAKESGAASVTCWGDGSPLREFLYVDDLANLCVFLMNNYSGNETVNAGTGKELTIKELTELVAKVVGYDGEIKWDSDYRMLINTERRQTVHYRADRMAFRVLLCMDGCGTISYDEGTVNFYKGDCVFVPADSEVLTIHGQAQFLDIRG